MGLQTAELVIMALLAIGIPLIFATATLLMRHHARHSYRR
ncbi:hypothetical protein HNR23_001260 [Nocardiopsis mwathae]|uniref:Uncharacterized protein n=1 Tax=Nocardiopsis mwathae TaxID=1472723 RepID=A0A7X0D4K4_9ACTN|nr:hypothetical protein [Nocardiopsis mwathae]